MDPGVQAEPVTWLWASLAVTSGERWRVQAVSQDRGVIPAGGSVPALFYRCSHSGSASSAEEGQVAFALALSFVPIRALCIIFI